MTGRYFGKIKVVSPCGLCFPADPLTLDPVGTSAYDPWPLIEPEANQIVDISDWNLMREAMRRAGPEFLPGVITIDTDKLNRAISDLDLWAPPKEPTK